MKTITVECCGDCPYMAMATLMPIGLKKPYCSKANRRNIHQAEVSVDPASIPSWCPLEDEELKVPGSTTTMQAIYKRLQALEKAALPQEPEKSVEEMSVKEIMRIIRESDISQPLIDVMAYLVKLVMRDKYAGSSKSMAQIGHKDKIGNEICIGDTVRVRFAGEKAKVVAMLVYEDGGHTPDPDWDLCLVLKKGVKYEPHT